jgi:phosphatidylinositol-3-phosphatase
MENKEYGDIIGQASAPFISSLTAQYGLATTYLGVAHPSQPNYIALFSGSTQGVSNDSVHNLSVQNLFDQVEAAGKTWRVFAENVPAGCFSGETARNGADGSGVYARKHNPAISFTDISRSAARCANITNFAHFDPAAADLEVVIPNLCHAMHDCSVSTGDAFLKGFVPRITSSQAWQNGGVIFLLWEEGTTNQGGGGRVPLIVISKRVAPGFRSDVTHDHYSLLRTIEDAWGMNCLNHSCKANNLSEFFR